MNSDHFNIREIGNFLVRRWFRTLPNYWLILTLNIILFRMTYTYMVPEHITGFYFFIQNFSVKANTFFPESWSLAVEEWYYLTIPFAILILNKVMRKSEKKKTLLVVFLIYSIIFFLIRVIFTNYNNTDPLYFDIGVRRIVTFRLDSIIYGFFIAYLVYFYKERLLKLKKILPEKNT